VYSGSLEGDERAGQAGFGAVEEETHAQRLSALDGDELHVAADVIAVDEISHLRFVVDGIPFEAEDAFFDHAAETGADFEAIVGDAVGDHGVLLITKICEAEKLISNLASWSFHLSRC
jgi:hypothetical protein